jgi:hypothetical protein
MFKRFVHKKIHLKELHPESGDAKGKQQTW